MLNLVSKAIEGGNEKQGAVTPIRFTAYSVYDTCCRSWLFISHQIRAFLVSCSILRYFVKDEMVMSYIRRSSHFGLSSRGPQLAIVGSRLSLTRLESQKTGTLEELNFSGSAACSNGFETEANTRCKKR